MLTRLRVQGFKSLKNVEFDLAELVIVFGPNAAGKSNVLESLVLLSRLVRERTLAEAFDAGIRGYPVEAFRVDEDTTEDAPRRLRIEADTAARPRDHEPRSTEPRRYAVEVEINPQTGELHLVDERLARIGKRRSNPAVERVDTARGPRIRVRRKDKQSHPYEEEPGIRHTLASNLQYSGKERFPDFDALREEVGDWHLVYLDPREAMRRAQPPREIEHIGERGEYLVPFLHRLGATHPRSFEAVVRAVRSVIPSIEGIQTELSKHRGELDLRIRQEGVWLPVRVISEGTLRVLALCAMAVNPWSRGLMALEEPENGVHPRRVQIIADLLARASNHRQVVVTTHSPLFVGEVLRRIREGELEESKVSLLRCASGPDGTTVRALASPGRLFDGSRVDEALRAADDLLVADAALAQGWLDG